VAEQPRGKVIECLAHLMALPGVTIEDHEQVEIALRHYRAGVDFADALHHASSEACSELLTFDDRRYVRRAARLELKPPVRLLAD
jgi:predicted nucleic-acid-binding protein